MKTPDDPPALTAEPPDTPDSMPAPTPRERAFHSIGASGRKPRELHPPLGFRGAGGSWIERLRARRAQLPIQITPGIAQRLRRAGVPETIIEGVPADPEIETWMAKLVTLPGVVYAGNEYVSTKVAFIALGKTADANKAVRLARVMRNLGWQRCKLHPHLGFGRKVVRGFRRPAAAGNGSTSQGLAGVPDTRFEKSNR
jgi:hypothetical protein